jgi:hypothetical protein
MGCLVRAFGLLILTGWIGFATWFLSEQKAHGEALLPALAILAPGVLIAAVLVGMALQRLVPGWRHGAGRGPAVASLVIAVVTLAGIYVAIDTTVPSRRPSRELTAALAPACRNQPVPGAGSISTDGTPNHLAVLAADGQEGVWTGHPSLDLRPPDLADAELVVCVEPREERTKLEVCQYTGGPPITRYATSRDVEVHAAATGKVVMAFTATAEPRRCRATESAELTELVGTLDWEQVASRLWYLVAWGADPATVIEVGRPVVLEAGLAATVGLVVENAGRRPLSAQVLLTYPGKDEGTLIETTDVGDLAPAERRVLTWRLADLDSGSATPVEARVGSVAAGEADPQRMGMARNLSISGPTLPVQPDVDTVEATIRNGSTAKLTGHVTVAFLAGGTLVAIAEGTIDAIAARASEPLALSLVGGADGATETFGQVDWAYEVE